MTRAAIYARYSSDNQREASIEDQVRLCKERAEKEGWAVVNIYTDHAISGSSLMLRPGVQSLMQGAMSGEFDVVVSEALDRISRDQEDIAGVFKRLQFSGVKIVTLSEGDISELHIGLKGTMNALFLKDLAAKTHRGLRGRVEKGKSGGGIVYGYDVVAKVNGAGEIEHGEREINLEQAAIVRRIFEDYAKGISPTAIAKQFNAEGIAAPNGGAWGPSTIYGNRARGTGILNNELYIGKLVWNRLRYRKNPETGKRMSQLNPKDQWITHDVPELRIVDQDLWDQVKILQGKYNKKDLPLHKKNRPAYLLSHLIKCGCCGGGFAMHNQKRLACSTAKNKGTCSNKLTIRRDELEASVIDTMREHLMDETLTKEFCAEYTKRMNELRKGHNKARRDYERELAKLEKEKQQIVQSICDGVPASIIKDRAIFVNERMEKLTQILDNQEEKKIIFHPQMADRYQKEIRNLIETLNQPALRAEASQMLRALINRVVLTPSKDGSRLTVDLVGDLAGILAVATNSDKRTVESDLSKHQPVQQTVLPETSETLSSCGLDASQAAMVAGARTTLELLCSSLDLKPKLKL